MALNHEKYSIRTKQASRNFALLQKDVEKPLEVVTWYYHKHLCKQ